LLLVDFKNIPNTSERILEVLYHIISQ